MTLLGSGGLPAGWCEFIDLSTDPVVVFDEQARVVLANPAAQRLLPCSVGAPVGQFRSAFGEEAVAWLESALSGAGPIGASPEVRLADHRPLRLTCLRLDATWWALRIDIAPDLQPSLPTCSAGPSGVPVVVQRVTDTPATGQGAERLLHELGALLESSTAGIACLRGDVLVRCNRRFGAMLNAGGGPVEGRTLEELFAGADVTGRIVTDAWQALTEGTIYETEFEVAAGRPSTTGAARWYSLSVRRTGMQDGLPEAIAVLADITRLKSQQIELQTLVRESELMFSLSGVGIAFVRGGCIQRANPALAHMSGRSVAELRDLPLSALFKDEEEFARRWSEAEPPLLEHGHWTGEHQLRRPDGRLLWVQASKRLVDPGEPAAGLIVSYVNVDSRHRAERSVALHAERTRSILDSVLVGVVTVGPQGIEWMNRSARRMFGGELSDFVNLPIATVATADPDHPFARSDALNDLVEGRAETFECRVQARDGRVFWVVGNLVSTARESTGRQLTYALLDIQRRREAEALMSQAQMHLRRIIEAAPLAITLRDAVSLKVVQVNGVAAANAGSAPEGLIGLVPEQMFHPETAAQRRRDMALALAATGPSAHEYRLEQGGVWRTWDARYLPLAARPGDPPDQLLLVETDVTEQRAAQEARLEAAVAQREMLVKEVHHRIKNNLQGVAGLLQQIAQKKPEVAGPIAEVVAQVQAIAQVYGLQVGEGGPLQLESVTRAICASVQRTFGRAIVFTAGTPDESPWLLPEAESIPIALTLNELLTNAVKHSTAAGVEVACTLTCTDAGAIVTLTNPGLLPAGFDLAKVPGGVSGLGLVRALLPRRGAVLTIAQAGDGVQAMLTVRPPVVNRGPADRQSRR